MRSHVVLTGTSTGRGASAASGERPARVIALSIRADDLAELVGAVLRMSRHAVVPQVVVSRPGAGLLTA